MKSVTIISSCARLREFVVVGSRSVVESSREGGRSLSTAEEETASPEDEDRQTNRDGKQQTNQDSYKYGGISFRPRSVQVQTAKHSMRQRRQIFAGVFRRRGANKRVDLIVHQLPSKFRQQRPDQILIIAIAAPFVVHQIQFFEQVPPCYELRRQISQGVIR